MNIREYLTYVYPKGKASIGIKSDEELEIFFDELTFYYLLNPEQKAVLPKGQYIHRNTDTMPQNGNLYSPSLINPDGFLCRNVYPPNNPLENKYKFGFESNDDIEICHSNVYDGNLGIYYYLVSGSGVYVNLGKTLVANNKLHALRLLGQSNVQIANALYEGATGYWPFYNKGTLPPNSSKSYFSTMVTTYSNEHNCSKDQAENDIINAAINESDYLLGRLNDTGWKIDELNFELGKAQGYDTIQLTTQANMNNGWAFEIIDLRVNGGSLDEVMNGLSQFMSIRNPFELSESQPIVNQWPYYNLYSQGTMSEIAKFYPSNNGRFEFPGPGFFPKSPIPGYPQFSTNDL